MGNYPSGQPDLAPSEDQVCECTDGQNCRDGQNDDERGALARARRYRGQGVADARDGVSNDASYGPFPVDLDDFRGTCGLSRRWRDGGQ